jgi:hypothetical protein
MQLVHTLEIWHALSLSTNALVSTENKRAFNDVSETCFPFRLHALILLSTDSKFWCEYGFFFEQFVPLGNIGHTYDR